MKQLEIKVALVDNHVMILEGLIDMLNKQDDVDLLFTAENGLEMQSQIQQKGVPDVVVMDIRMPVMNGYRATQWLTTHHPKVMVLAVTAFEDGDAVAEMLRCGARGFITKAEGHAELYRAILELGRTGRYVNSHVSQRDLEDAAFDSGVTKKSMDVLSQRKQEFLKLCCTDLSYEQIAQQLEVSHASVKRYAEELYEHFGVRTRHALVAHAFRMGLIATDGKE